MRILFVHQNFPGQYRHLAPALAARGHEVHAMGITDNPLAAQQPANAWFAALDFGGDAALKKTAMEQCSFCHQQGSFFMRRERSAEEWQQVMERMIGYGARPSSEHQPKLIEVFQKGYTDLRQHPEKVLRAKPWERQLAGAQVREWPLGDPFSQMHDLLLHSNGKVYVGDNLQDRLWEIDPKTGGQAPSTKGVL